MPQPDQNPVCPKCRQPLKPEVSAGLKIWARGSGLEVLGQRGCLAKLVPGRADLAPTAVRPAPQGPACPGPDCSGQLAPCQPNPAGELEVDICDRCGAVWFDAEEMRDAAAVSEAAAAERDLAGQKFSWLHGLFTILTRLPFEYNIKPRRKPLVVYGLIGLNILVFALTSVYTSPLDLGLTPADPVDLRWLGRLFSSMFSHRDLPHLLVNMYFLHTFGDNVEDLVGRGVFLRFYLTAGVVAGLAHVFLTGHPDIPYVGASGAISGVMGAYMMYCRRARLTFNAPLLWLVSEETRRVSPLVWFGLYMAAELAAALILGEADGVAHWAHVGGFIFGLGFGRGTYAWVLERNPFLKLLNLKKPEPASQGEKRPAGRTAK